MSVAEKYRSDEGSKQTQGEPQAGTAAARYAALEILRQPYLDRARECSLLTIPALVPPEGWLQNNGASRLYTPFQSLGARGVNHLSSKLLLGLFPPNAPIFRLKMDEQLIEEAEKTQKDFRTLLEKALAKTEKNVSSEIETGNMRGSLFEAIKHLVVAGNALVYKPKKNDLRVFHLDRFVVKRDAMGNVLEIIVKETVSPTVLQEQFKAQVYAKIAREKGEAAQGDAKSCDLYTHIKREEGHFTVCQEVHGMIVPGSEGNYPLDKNPWIPLRWMRIDGEDYGRGHCEEYLGDLQSLEGLSQSIVEGSAAAAKLLILVNPNGTTKLKTLQDAPNGAIREGNKEDVGVLQLEKFNDFRVARETADGIEKRLSYAFLLNSSVQRQGERVTAEEIRYMIQELEDALGGVYSVLAVELQLPFIRVLMADMQSQGRLPRFPKGAVKPTIVTGLQALGRGQDLDRLRTFVKIMTEAYGPEGAARFTKPSNFAIRVATALALDTEGLVPTEEELQAEAQAAQQQKLVDTVTPEIIKGAAANPEALAAAAQGGGQPPQQ